MSIKQDDFIKQEIFAARAELYLETGNIDKTEQALKSAYELNSYAFAPALVRFYANFRSLKLALSIFEKHLATYHDPAIALQTAEIYCLLKKKDEITKLRNQYQGDSGNQAMLLCYYFDAMNALINDDMALLKELLVPLRKNLSTPLALFMFFCADIQDSVRGAESSDCAPGITFRMDFSSLTRSTTRSCPHPMHRIRTSLPMRRTENCREPHG